MRRPAVAGSFFRGMGRQLEKRKKKERREKEKKRGEKGKEKGRKREKGIAHNILLHCTAAATLANGIRKLGRREMLLLTCLLSTIHISE